MHISSLLFDHLANQTMSSPRDCPKRDPIFMGVHNLLRARVSEVNHSRDNKLIYEDKKPGDASLILGIRYTLGCHYSLNNSSQCQGYYCTWKDAVTSPGQRLRGPIHITWAVSIIPSPKYLASGGKLLPWSVREHADYVCMMLHLFWFIHNHALFNGYILSLIHFTYVIYTVVGKVHINATYNSLYA